MEGARIVTLLTDFGTADVYAAVLRGVILREAPGALPVDLTHEIPPHAVRLAAVFLADALPYFPPDAIHLVVVDPGVGTGRRGLAARGPGGWGVGPDNGVLTPILREAVEVVEISQSRHRLEPVSATFHGRDLFAPVAAALARGARLGDLGPPVADPRLVELPEPVREEDLVTGEVIHVDRFGNLVTSIRERDLAGWRRVTVEVAGVCLPGLAPNYLDGPDDLRALFGGMGRLEIARRQGSAAASLGAGVGERVRVRRKQARLGREGDVTGRGREDG